MKADSSIKEFNEGRSWYRRRADILTIGVTLQALDEIGEVEGIEVPEEGDEIRAGECLVTIEGSLGSLEIEAPDGGTVLEVNLSRHDTEKLQADPLEEGWILKLQLS